MSNQANLSRMRTEVLEAGEHKNCVLMLSKPTKQNIESLNKPKGENQPYDSTLVTYGQEVRTNLVIWPENTWQVKTIAVIERTYANVGENQPPVRKDKITHHIAGSADEDQSCTSATWMQVRTNLTSEIQWDLRRYYFLDESHQECES